MTPALERGVWLAHFVEAMNWPWFFGKFEPLFHFYNQSLAPDDRWRNLTRRVGPEISLLKLFPKRSWRYAVRISVPKNNRTASYPVVIAKLAGYPGGFVDDNHRTVDVDWARAERNRPAHTAQRQTESGQIVRLFSHVCNRRCDATPGKVKDSRSGFIQ